MQWSRYNTLFRYEGYGRFCYNALSNTLIELDEIHYRFLEGCQRSVSPCNEQDNAFFRLLCNKHILIRAAEEENILVAHQARRQAVCVDTSRLDLTICPTLRCNFRCSYCFESSLQNGRFMSVSTQERLIDWIREHKNINTLSIAWYGGEPLLAFDTICTLTERFLSTGLHYEKASLITNGYLLDGDKIQRLNDLRIGSIQITLDGPAESHDTRRVLTGGAPTFARIMENIEALMASNYTGTCRIRVNLDMDNLKGFIGLRSELLSRFKGKRLVVYPAPVHVIGNHAYGGGGCINTSDWTSFKLEAVRSHGVPMPLHPGKNLDSTCVACVQQSFVLGPEGELYKCWDDVGHQAMAVGNIHATETITDTVLLEQYLTGVDPYQDQQCLDCVVLPICGGGCARRRLLVKYHGLKGIEYCSPYKTRLRDYLEAYIETVWTREMFSNLLQPEAAARNPHGYRIISPAALQRPDPAHISDHQSRVITPAIKTSIKH